MLSPRQSQPDSEDSAVSNVLAEFSLDCIIYHIIIRHKTAPGITEIVDPAPELIGKQTGGNQLNYESMSACWRSRYEKIINPVLNKNGGNENFLLRINSH